MKTHYRKIAKSDHLSSADLEDMIEAGSDLIFTIKEVKQQFGALVAGKKVDANIAYFTDKIKPLVLNATNAKVISKFAGSGFIEDWSGTIIQLFIDHNVKFKGDVVDGVRIKKTKPAPQKTKEEVLVMIESCETKPELNALRAYIAKYDLGNEANAKASKL
jgi:hypothetical protein